MSVGTSLRRQVNFTRPCPPDPLGLLGQGLVQKYSLVPADLRCTGASRAQEGETQIHKLPTCAAPALLLFLQVSQSRTGSEFKGLLGFNKILASMHENIMREVPAECDVNIARNGPFWVEVANPEHPFTAILISLSRGTCLSGG